jgi:three-Cys-motif partner protein
MIENFFEEQREQSRVKAEIVAKYFDAWATIITSVQKRNPLTEQRIAYIDLFSGPGRYKDGAASTPLMILEKAIANPIYRDRLLTLFNDKDPSNAKNLKDEIAKLPDIAKLKHQPVVQNKEVGPEIAKHWETMRTIPVLAFIDPWGYKGLSLQLIQAFLKDWGCDCIVFFNYQRINRDLTNPVVQKHMEALFGPERAASLKIELKQLDPSEREATIVEALAKALKEYGANKNLAPYVLPFCFKAGEDKRTTHHLVFVTKHFRGYEVMKTVMAKASAELNQGVPSFSYFPAASSRQQLLFNLNRPLDDLREMLLESYAGKRATMRQIYEAHSVDRPYTDANYKTVLRALEDEGKIQTDGRRSPRGFADDVVAIFPEVT